MQKTVPEAVVFAGGFWYTVLAITRPAAVVIAQLRPIPAGLPAATYSGSVHRVDVDECLSDTPFVSSGVV